MEASSQQEKLLSVGSAWECNICLGELKDPVTTTCGHLFCWPCLYPWVHHTPKPCPVCRSTLLAPDSNIIAIYNGLATGAESHDGTAPPRPRHIVSPPLAPPANISTPTATSQLRQLMFNLHPQLPLPAAIHAYYDILDCMRREEEEAQAGFARQEMLYQNAINARAWRLSEMRGERERLRSEVRRLARRDQVEVARARTAAAVAAILGRRQSSSATADDGNEDEE